MIIVKAALILYNVYVFSPKQSGNYLNITTRNVVKIFHKNTLTGNGSSVGGSGSDGNLIEEQEGLTKPLEDGPLTEEHEHQLRLGQ